MLFIISFVSKLLHLKEQQNQNNENAKTIDYVYIAKAVSLNALTKLVFLS